MKNTLLPLLLALAVNACGGLESPWQPVRGSQPASLSTPEVRGLAYAFALLTRSQDNVRMETSTVASSVEAARRSTSNRLLVNRPAPEQAGNGTRTMDLRGTIQASGAEEAGSTSSHYENTVHLNQCDSLWVTVKSGELEQVGDSTLSYSDFGRAYQLTMTFKYNGEMDVESQDSDANSYKQHLVFKNFSLLYNVNQENGKAVRFRTPEDVVLSSINRVFAEVFISCQGSVSMNGRDMDCGTFVMTASPFPN